MEDAAKMLASTGADGIMIARYGLEHPFIFCELTGTPCQKTPLQILLEQLELTEQYYDETFTLSYMKKIASYMMKKRKGTKRYKESLYRSGSLEDLRNVIALIFADLPT